MPNARKTRLAATKKRVRTVPLQYTTIIEHCAPFFKGNAKVFLLFSRGEGINEVSAYHVDFSPSVAVSGLTTLPSGSFLACHHLAR